jgi:Protein of unknown function (DUF3987)
MSDQQEAWTDETAPDDDENVKYFAQEKEQRQSGAKPKGPKPIDFTKAICPAPECPLDLLPKVLGDFVNDIAYRMQASLDLVAIPAICGAGTVLGRHVTVRPLRNDDWTERAALWGIVCAPPGAMKSPAAKAALKPLHKMQQEYNDELKADMAAYHEAMREYNRLTPKEKRETDKPSKPQDKEYLIVTNTTGEALSHRMDPRFNRRGARGMLFAMTRLPVGLTD